MTSKRYVAYFRVSTARQGQSGLGLEAQQTAVRSFVAADAVIVEEFIEVESGRRNDRPRCCQSARREMASRVRSSFAHRLMCTGIGRVE